MTISDLEYAASCVFGNLPTISNAAAIHVVRLDAAAGSQSVNRWVKATAKTRAAKPAKPLKFVSRVEARDAATRGMRTEWQCGHDGPTACAVCVQAVRHAADALPLACAAGKSVRMLSRESAKATKRAAAAAAAARLAWQGMPAAAAAGKSADAQAVAVTLSLAAESAAAAANTARAAAADATATLAELRQVVTLPSDGMRHAIPGPIFLPYLKPTR